MGKVPSLHAAIDLGSNSFHLLVVREVAGALQTVAKLKRKVRLAAGLNAENQLSAEAIQRGLDCIRLFADQLRAIPSTHIRVVATATLRVAINAPVFLEQAQHILERPIEVISGEEEARLIYQGVAQTTSGSDQRLVVDIGGGSTELVTGSGLEATALCSLSMGCVTWLERYFADRLLTEQNFSLAETAARQMIQPIKAKLIAEGWQICVGASGTVQALQEIMVAQGMDEQITLAKLEQLKAQAIQCGKLEELEIAGLTLERALVFPSGLSILLAIFHELAITQMNLAGGALREGLIYGMLPLPVDKDIQTRSLEIIQQRFAVDVEQADRVKHLCQAFLQQVADVWQLDAYCQQLLITACSLHELGLAVNFRQHAAHSAYLIEHLDLPGFTPAQQQLVATLLFNQQGDLDVGRLNQQSAISRLLAERLCRLFRLAVMLASTRAAINIDNFRLNAAGEVLTLVLAADWRAAHPLFHELLKHEEQRQSAAHWPLIIC